jgi:hypothetical protein
MLQLLVLQMLLSLLRLGGIARLALWSFIR